MKKVLFIALILGTTSLKASEKMRIEVVQTETDIKMSVGSLNVPGSPATTVTHCDGTSGIYSKEYGYDCTTTSYPSTPEHAQRYLDRVFSYEVKAIMPDGAHLILRCSNILSKRCEGFPSYSNETQVTCNNFVLAGAYYSQCTATGPAPKSIGLYEAERNGDKIVVFGQKWKREYRINSSW